MTRQRNTSTKFVNKQGLCWKTSFAPTEFPLNAFRYNLSAGTLPSNSDWQHSVRRKIPKISHTEATTFSYSHNYESNVLSAKAIRWPFWDRIISISTCCSEKDYRTVMKTKRNGSESNSMRNWSWWNRLIRKTATSNWLRCRLKNRKTWIEWSVFSLQMVVIEFSKDFIFRRFRNEIDTFLKSDEDEKCVGTNCNPFQRKLIYQLLEHGYGDTIVASSRSENNQKVWLIRSLRLHINHRRDLRFSGHRLEKNQIRWTATWITEGRNRQRTHSDGRRYWVFEFRELPIANGEFSFS